jgi:hypothetical protein
MTRLRLCGDELDDLLAHPVQVRAELDQHLRGHAVALTDEAEQDVLGADVVVIEPPGFFFGQLHSTPRPVGKPLQHRPPPRATEQKLAVRPEHRPDGTWPGLNVLCRVI